MCIGKVSEYGDVLWRTILRLLESAITGKMPIHKRGHLVHKWKFINIEIAAL
jgi:hypothetical protein